MTSDFKKYRTSLIRRFQTIDQNNISQRSDFVGRLAHRSFAMSYLLSYSDGDFETFDVLVAKAALGMARRDSRSSGLAVVDQFLEGTEASLVRQIVHGERDCEVATSLSLPDKYLLGTNGNFSLSSSEKRKCYDEVLKGIGVNTPFDKKGMLVLLRRIDPDYEGQKVSNFAQLSDFIWEFVESSWPLFETSVLHIPLIYFSFDIETSSDTIGEHLQLMSAYGLERLLGRLVVLQAVCGRISAKEAVLQHGILEQCEYEQAEIEKVLFYLDGETSQVTKDDLTEVGRGNPIQRATYLAIYLNESRGPFDFLERLIDVYCIDPSVLTLIDWEPLLELIESTSDYYCPELVAMAAILSEEGVLEKSPLVKKLYIPTSANTDFFNYAKFCREERELSPHQFFATFAKLPINAQTAIFTYILSPGHMDTIAHVFPSSKQVLAQVNTSYTVNALTIKLDCISYLKKRGLLKQNYLRIVEESTRQRLRQIKYESETGEGRIRLSTRKLAATVLEFYEDEFDQVRLDSSHLDYKQTALRNFLEKQAYEDFSVGLARHICFESRVAFDYLLSNLRHNFLRFKVESGIDSAFHQLGEQNLSAFKSVIAGTLDDYYRKWLTIYEERSFFEGLSEQIYDTMRSSEGGKLLSSEVLAQKLADLAKSRFDSLLAECRRVWTSEVRQEVIGLVLSELSFSEFSKNTALEDAIETELGRAFEDAEGWLTVNNNPINREFGLRDLFLFESTNFSSARTRVRPLHVECYEQSQDERQPRLMNKDIMIPGHLFDAMVQLVQNLLENAFKYSRLPISETSISVSIVDRSEGGIAIEFRNNFDGERREEMNQLLMSFNKKIREARQAVFEAPLEVGGSGLRRIYFEFHSVFGEEFSLSAESTEFRKDIFLINCYLPHQNGFHSG